MTVDHEGGEYVYVQLAAILRERIRSGELPPGRGLPSARTLAQQYGVSIGTVKKAVEVLRADGLVRTVKKAVEVLRADGLVRTVIGRGIFVARPQS